MVICFTGLASPWAGSAIPAAPGRPSGWSSDDAVGLVVVVLLLAAPLGLVNGPAHGGGNLVGVENDLAVGIPGRPADGLNEGGLAAQKPSLSASRMATRLTSGRSRPSRSRLMPTSTSKEPSRRSRIISIRSMVSMSWCIPHLDAHFCRYWVRSSAIFLVGVVTSTRSFRAVRVDLPDQVVDLAPGWAGPPPWGPAGPWADHLLHDLAGAGGLVLPGGGGDIDHLVEPLLELLKFQGPVVKGAGQPEAVVHQGGFFGPGLRCTWPEPGAG